MKKHVFFSLMAIAFMGLQGMGQIITVDGNPSDWTGIPSATVHGTVISNNQWIYTGASSDRRTDAGMTDDADIKEVRITNDGTSIFGLIKVLNLSIISNFHIGMSIGYTTGGSRNYTWIGASSSLALGAGGVQYSERNIDIHYTGSGLSIEMWDGGSWYSPSTSQIAYSTTNNCVEFSISLSDLGTSSGATLALTLASFMNQQGNTGSWWNNDGDGNTTINYGTDDAVDVMTPGSAAGNAWPRDLDDGNAGFYGSIPLATALLPLKLTSFTAQKSGAIGQLNWNTLNEKNSAYFEVERAVNGQDFISIAKVAANGNSTLPITYTFTDNQPATGVNYYRLKMMDLDGQFEYSDIVSLNFNMVQAGIRIFPNPGRDMEHLYTSQQIRKIIIFNSMGDLVKVINAKAESDGSYPINTQDLPNGVYQIVSSFENGQRANTEMVLSR